MTSVVGAYSQTIEGRARLKGLQPRRVANSTRLTAVPPVWDRTRLIRAARGDLRLPNPGGSPGCSPILRELLTQSGLPYFVDVEVMDDADPLGHKGGNAIDVRAPSGDDLAALFDLCVQMRPLFKLVAYQDPAGQVFMIWLGQDYTGATGIFADFASRCTGHVHIASNFTTLLAGLEIVPTGADDDTSPAATMDDPPENLGPTVNEGITNDRVYLQPVNDGGAKMNTRPSVT